MRNPARIPRAATVVAALLLLLPHLTAPPTGAASPGPAAPPPTVMVAPVTEQDVTPATEYVGHVEAIQQVDLRARVEGFLEKIGFREGDFVQAGDLLYVIEQAPYRARVAEAEARVEEAAAEADLAAKHLERLRAAGTESVSATALDDAAAAAQTAQARLDEARAALDLARLDLGYTTITAPIAGRIGRTAYTVGNLVNPASGPLARIVQVDPIRVVYAVSENDLPALRAALTDTGNAGRRLLEPRLRLANGEPYDHPGRVTFVDNQVDPSTGTIAVRAEFANPDGLLVPGQYVTVLVKAAAPKMMVVVPQNAVLMNRDGRFVLMVDEAGTVEPRPITIGPAVGGTMWAVESGLVAGEEIIVAGIQKVRPGQVVSVANDRKVKTVPAAAPAMRQTP